MCKVSNRKLIHPDGGVQWVMQRTIYDNNHNHTFQHNVYFRPDELRYRSWCAMRLNKARRELCEAAQPIPADEIAAFMMQNFRPKMVVYQ